MRLQLAAAIFANSGFASSFRGGDNPITNAIIVPLGRYAGTYQGIREDSSGSSLVTLNIKSTETLDFTFNSDSSIYGATEPLEGACDDVNYFVSARNYPAFSLVIGSGNECMQALADKWTSQISTTLEIEGPAFHFWYSAGNDFVETGYSFGYTIILSKVDEEIETTSSTVEPFTSPIIVPLGRYAGTYQGIREDSSGSSHVTLNIKSATTLDFTFHSDSSIYGATEPLEGACDDVDFYVFARNYPAFTLVIGSENECMQALADKWTSQISTTLEIEGPAFLFWYSAGNDYVETGYTFGYTFALSKVDSTVEPRANPSVIPLGCYLGTLGESAVRLNMKTDNTLDLSINLNASMYGSTEPLEGECYDVEYSVDSKHFPVVSIDVGSGNECLETLVKRWGPLTMTRYRIEGPPFRFWYTAGRELIETGYSFCYPIHLDKIIEETSESTTELLPGVGDKAA